MDFLDRYTSEQIDFAYVQSKITPITPLGQQLFRTKRPFVYGEEVRWQDDRNDALQLEARVGTLQANGKDMRANLVASLSAMPDMEPVLRLLHHREPLLVEHFAMLKRFLFFAEEMNGYLREARVHFTWWQVDTGQILRILQKDDFVRAPTFSLQDAGLPDLQQAYEMFERIRAKRVSLEHEYGRQLGVTYAVPLRRDQTLILSIEEMGRIITARNDARLRMRLQTPFECVFEPVWPTEHEELVHAEDVARERVAVLEQVVLKELTRKLLPFYPLLDMRTKEIAHLDELLARISLSSDHGYTWSTLSQSDIQLVGGYPPAHANFTPIDVTLHSSVSVLTGPNMGGKTVALKTLLLVMVCHHYGYPVPVTMFSAPLVQHVRYVGGDAQSLQSGLSSFGAEIVAIQLALALPDALLCFDEIGRSTNPVEGMALIEAIVCEVQRDSHRKLFCATHFPLQIMESVTNLRIRGVRQEALSAKGECLDVTERLRLLQASMDYRIVVHNDTDVPHEGLNIAKWLGLDERIFQAAQKIVDRVTQGNSR